MHCAAFGACYCLKKLHGQAFLLLHTEAMSWIDRQQGSSTEVILRIAQAPVTETDAVARALKTIRAHVAEEGVSS